MSKCLVWCQNNFKVILILCLHGAYLYQFVINQITTQQHIIIHYRNTVHITQNMGEDWGEIGPQRLIFALRVADPTVGLSISQFSIFFVVLLYFFFIRFYGLTFLYSVGSPN